MNYLTYEEYEKLIRNNGEPEFPKDFKGECRVSGVLDMLQGKWKGHVLFALCAYDTVRFSQLKKKMPYITNAALINTLKELEEHRLLTRTQYNEMPPRVEYSLTEKGRELLPVFYRMYVWSVKYQDK